MFLDPERTSKHSSALMDMETSVIIPHMLYTSKVTVGASAVVYTLHITPFINLGVTIPTKKT